MRPLRPAPGLARAPQSAGLKELESQSGKTPPLLAAPREEQVSMEAISEAEVIDRLRRAQPDAMTPIEAMGLLYELKQKLS